MTKNKVVRFFSRKIGWHPTVAAPGDTDPSDAAENDCKTPNNVKRKSRIRGTGWKQLLLLLVLIVIAPRNGHRRIQPDSRKYTSLMTYCGRCPRWGRRPTVSTGRTGYSWCPRNRRSTCSYMQWFRRQDARSIDPSWDTGSASTRPPDSPLALLSK